MALVAAWASAAAAEHSGTLIQPIESVEAIASVQGISEFASPADVDHAAIALLEVGDRFSIRLAGRDHSVSVKSAVVSPRGVRTIRAIDAHGEGLVILSAKDGHVSGLISLSGEIRQINPSGGAHSHLLVKPNPHAVCGTCLGAPQAPDDHQDQPPLKTAEFEAFSEISGEVLEPSAGPPHASPTQSALADVLVAYTPTTLEAIGSVPGVESLIEASVASFNDAAERSDTPTRINLVAIVATTYDDDPQSILTDLFRLRTANDGQADDILGYRDAYQADLVALITGGLRPAQINGQSVAGVATLGPASNSVYSVSEHLFALGNLTFAHEIGHNYGCQHEYENASAPSDTIFAYGLRRTTSPQFRTVMATGSEPRIPNFSNPDIDYQGVPTGAPGVGAASADNARHLEEVGHIVAGFKTGEPDLTDCDSNGELDAVEIAMQPSLDCDGDGTIDACQITQGLAEDCNTDGVIDICQLGQPVSAIGLRHAPLELGGQYNDTFNNLPAALGPVTLTFDIVGDFTQPGTRLDLSVNGTFFGTIIDNGSFCGQALLRTTTFLTPEQFNAGSGTLTTRVSALGDPAVSCDDTGQDTQGDESSLRVRIDYAATDGSIDADFNGIIDECELCLGDITGDDTIGADDFFLIILRFGSQQDGPANGDIDNDGTVDADDFFFIIQFFGKTC